MRIKLLWAGTITAVVAFFALAVLILALSLRPHTTPMRTAYTCVHGHVRGHPHRRCLWGNARGQFRSPPGSGDIGVRG